MNEYDDFGDVRGSTSGIFGDEQSALQPAHSRHHKVTTQPQPGGVLALLYCQSCGKQRQIGIHYAELLSCFFGVPPHVGLQGIQLPGYVPSQWTYSVAHGWVPVLRCQCGDNIQPGLSMQEIQQHLETARRAGWLPQQAEAQLSQVIGSRRQG